MFRMLYRISKLFCHDTAEYFMYQTDKTNPIRLKFIHKMHQIFKNFRSLKILNSPFMVFTVNH